MPDHLSSLVLSQLSAFVADRIGLHFSNERWPDLERGIRSVMREFEFDDAGSCVQWLVSSPVTQRTIETLASHLTVGETYFFREQQSFQALKEHVLPELIRKRRGVDRHLRIWSAGCCTGEEAYSIAILLRQVLSDFKDWQITILGTDINARFLNKAVGGLYNEWSFRGVPPELKERCFAKKPHGRFEVQPEIKRMATFSYLNLVEDSYPSLLNNTNAMDIIFCRNVLMYFLSERAKQVIRRFHLSLTDGGWLIVSPSETSHVLYSQFATVNFPGTIFYKKDRHKVSGEAFYGEPNTLVESALSSSFESAPEPKIPIADLAEKFAVSDVPEPKMLEEAEQSPYAKSLDFYGQGFYEEAAQMLSTLLSQNPGDFKAMALLVRVYANQGKLTDANLWCEKVLRADKMNPACHVLQATILQEQGAIPEAIRALQRALYLDQNLVLAHFALGNITRQQGKTRDATKHFENARMLLSSYSPDEPLPEAEGITAGRLMEIIRSTNDAQVGAISRERNTQG
jgi:chemotaxis protein methyltransferase CheR